MASPKFAPCCASPVTLPGCASVVDGRRYIARNYRTWPVCPLHGTELTVTRFGSDPAKLGCPRMAATYTLPTAPQGVTYTFTFVPATPVPHAVP